MSARSCPTDAVELAPIMTPFGYPRDFLHNRFVYVAVSSRARGLAIGLNLNPDRLCNFDCVYCEVNRDAPSLEQNLDIPVMAAELERTLLLIGSGEIRDQPRYRRLPPDLLQLRQVALSGDGEPTLCRDFARVVQAVVHVRTRRLHPFFKLVLLTNGTGLDLRPVQEGLLYFTNEDEIWIKLDAGTQSYMDAINRSEVPLEKIIENALHLGRQRPIVIQSMFTLIREQEPPAEEIDQYIQRLVELKRGGANISLVQIYSASRPMVHSECGHLPLKCLAAITRRIRAETGLPAEVF